MRVVRHAVLVSFLVTMPSLAAEGLPEPKAGAIERILSSWMSKHGIPGLSAAVAVDGRILWSSAYGMADVENFVPAKVETAYRSASIGKPMTATAAMRLVETGKLDLDAPVQRYCPAFPVKAWPLTTRDLLRHMGGVRHYGGPHDQAEQLSTRHYRSVSESLEPFRDDPCSSSRGRTPCTARTATTSSAASSRAPRGCRTWSPCAPSSSPRPA